jgi:hypothetical protein
MSITLMLPASWAQTLDDAPNLWGATQGNELVVAVGEQGAIFIGDSTSSARAWRKAFSGSPVWLLGVAYGNGKFFVRPRFNFSTISSFASRRRASAAAITAPSTARDPTLPRPH